MQQRLQSILERDPTIGQFRQFYQKGEGDTTAEDMLAALKTSKQRLKEKQAAIAPPN